MSRLATTKLSSRGQIVIPENIREQMHLHVGDQFVVIAEKDVVILKMISRPNIGELKKLVNSARKAAKEEGLEEVDIIEAIAKSHKKSIS